MPKIIEWVRKRLAAWLLRGLSITNPSQNEPDPELWIVEAGERDLYRITGVRGPFLIGECRYGQRLIPKHIAENPAYWQFVFDAFSQQADLAGEKPL